jgi:hypothetical protein
MDLQTLRDHVGYARGASGLHRIGDRFADIGVVVRKGEGGICITSTGKQFGTFDEWAAAIRHARSP